MTQITRLFITSFSILLFYLSLEGIQRKYKVRTEITRKIAHVCSGVFAILFSYILYRNEFIVVSLLFFFFFLFTYFTKSLKSISVSDRRTIGEITYPLGVIVLAMSLYGAKWVFIGGLLILAVPDAVAGLVGLRLRQTGKSAIGSMSYFICSLIILAFLRDPLTAAGIAAVLTLIEMISPFGFDNLTVPIGYLLLVSHF